MAHGEFPPRALNRGLLAEPKSMPKTPGFGNVRPAILPPVSIQSVGRGT